MIKGGSDMELLVIIALCGIVSILWSGIELGLTIVINTAMYGIAFIVGGLALIAGVGMAMLLISQGILGSLGF